MPLALAASLAVPGCATGRSAYPHYEVVVGIDRHKQRILTLDRARPPTRFFHQRVSIPSHMTIFATIARMTSSLSTDETAVREVWG